MEKLNINLPMKEPTFKTYLSLLHVFKNNDNMEMLNIYCNDPYYQNLYTHSSLYKSGVIIKLNDDELFFTLKRMLNYYISTNLTKTPNKENISKFVKEVKKALDVENNFNKKLIDNNVDPQQATDDLEPIYSLLSVIIILI